MITIAQILEFADAAERFRRSYSMRHHEATKLVDAWRAIDFACVDNEHIDDAAESSVSMLTLILERETNYLQRSYLQSALDYALVRLAENIIQIDDASTAEGSANSVAPLAAE